MHAHDHTSIYLLSLRQEHLRMQIVNAAIQVISVAELVPLPYPGPPSRLNTQKVESLHGEPGYGSGTRQGCLILK